MSLVLSAALKQNLNPINTLQQDLNGLLEAGELALYMMSTPPPTPEEALLGMQTYNVTDYGSSGRIVHMTITAMQECAGVFPLNPEQWALASDKRNQLLNLSQNPDTKSMMHLVPKEDIDAVTVRHSFEIRHRNLTLLERPVQWALLGRVNDSLLGRTWFRHLRNASHGELISQNDRILDFRGMVPLSVGKVGSTANIWMADSQHSEIWHTASWKGNSGRYRCDLLDHLDIHKIELGAKTTLSQGA
ncbi:hypothetical protein [Pseudoalteromonas umbrosa]|uniref:hypothetical protein n=1 Tax=Pseudoalteromonas umbrosa TaxID=3048489 RepID=UPI0024C2596F|nr:hypothetical protein [Pseudoalteromonas sp. B95]MDK1290070.1 hypothetical protein [Pseudoalteromonas sp. B95]